MVDEKVCQRVVVMVLLSVDWWVSELDSTMAYPRAEETVLNLVLSMAAAMVE